VARIPKKVNRAASIADVTRLKPEDREALTAAARQAVDDELDQQARDAFYASELARLRAEQIPEEAIVQVTVDLPEFSNCLMIDGVRYFHGYTYEVPHPRRMVMLEQMQRAYIHQHEIDTGKSRYTMYRRPQNITIGPRDAGTPTAGANGAVVANLD
jgi:hypothetical protein